jgi:hypothetical protein
MTRKSFYETNKNNSVFNQAIAMFSAASSQGKLTAATVDQAAKIMAAKIGNPEAEKHFSDFGKALLSHDVEGFWNKED